MLRPFSEWLGIFMIATVGPCFAEPNQDHVDGRASPGQQTSMDQVDSSLAVPLDAFEAANVQPQADLPTQALLVSIARWLSATFDKPAIEPQPRIEIVSMAALTALRFHGSPTNPTSHVEIGRSASPNIEHDLVALYEDATQTIYLQAGWTGTSPADLSVLVHEMVHHMQNVAELTYECAEARERPAYVAQQQWLELFGQSLEDEFSIDPMTLLVRTTCMM